MARTLWCLRMRAPRHDRVAGRKERDGEPVPPLKAPSRVSSGSDASSVYGAMRERKIKHQPAVCRPASSFP
jgi:hypothetical protein